MFGAVGADSRSGMGFVQVPKYLRPFATMASWMLCAAWRSSRGSAKGAAVTSALAVRREIRESFMVGGE